MNSIVVVKSTSRVQLFVTPWTIALQVSLSMGFFRQKYWSGLPFPPPGDLLHPGIKLASLVSPALASGFFTTSITWEAWKPGGEPSHWGAQGGETGRGRRSSAASWR